MVLYGAGREEPWIRSAARRSRRLDRLPERPHHRRPQLPPPRADADAELGELRLQVEDGQGAAQRAVVRDQARHDADAAAEADQRQQRLAAGDLAVEART